MSTAEINGQARGIVTGVETCGSPSLCLHCGAKIRARRAEQIGQVLRTHLDQGGHALFVTLTMSHTNEDSAAGSLDDALIAWSKMTNTRAWRRLMTEIGLEGFVRNTEVTHSDRAGWHPHHHVALLTTEHVRFDDYDGGRLFEVEGRIYGLWAYQVNQLGRTVHPAIGVEVVPIRDDRGIGYHVSKIECELTRSDLKRGRWESRSTWQIGLDAAAGGDPRDVALWREFVEASRRHRYMATSRGLFAKYGVTDDQDDTEIAEETPDDTDTVAFVEADLYTRAAKADSDVLAELRGLLESRATPTVLTAVLSRRLGIDCRLEHRADDNGIPTITSQPGASP